jgi:hypothetical protein
MDRQEDMFSNTIKETEENSPVNAETPDRE